MKFHWLLGKCASEKKSDIRKEGRCKVGKGNYPLSLKGVCKEATGQIGEAKCPVTVSKAQRK